MPAIDNRSGGLIIELRRVEVEAFFFFFSENSPRYEEHDVDALFTSRRAEDQN